MSHHQASTSRYWSDRKRATNKCNYHYAHTTSSIYYLGFRIFSFHSIRTLHRLGIKMCVEERGWSIKKLTVSTNVSAPAVFLLGQNFINLPIGVTIQQRFLRMVMDLKLNFYRRIYGYKCCS